MGVWLLMKVSNSRLATPESYRRRLIQTRP